MNSIVLAGAAYNAVPRLATPPVPTNANALFPVANLASGRPDEPFVFADLTGTQVELDLNMVPNGGFEAAFVGGLPAPATAGASWGKSAGATLTRNTATPYAGAGCLAIAGGQDEYGYVDVVCSPGERIGILVRARTTAAGLGNVARLTVRNLATGHNAVQDAGVGSWVADETATWLQVEAQAYSGGLGWVVVEGFATCGQDPITLRFACWGGSSSAPLYDDVYVWVVPSWISIHGHNITPACGGLDVLAGFTTPATLRGTLPVVRPATFLRPACDYTDRFVRLALQAPPLVDPIHIGELVIADAGAFLAPRWGSEHSLAHAQDRTEDQVQAYLLTAESEQRARLQLVTRDGAEFERVRDALTRSRLGGFPLVVADADDPASAMIARPAAEWAYTRDTPDVRRASLELRALPLPNVVP